MSRPDAQAETTLDGFIILGPGFPIEMGCHTFGRTMTEAWERHIGPRGSRDVGERETLRSRWAQKGWRPVPARLVVLAPPSDAQREGE